VCIHHEPVKSSDFAAVVFHRCDQRLKLSVLLVFANEPKHLFVPLSALYEDAPSPLNICPIVGMDEVEPASLPDLIRGQSEIIFAIVIEVR
jgi:hypothetical protein